MFRKKGNKMWQISWFGALFCFMGILFVIPCSAQKAPQGEATVIFLETFQMTGGDCHTAVGGNFRLYHAAAVFAGSPVSIAGASSSWAITWHPVRLRKGGMPPM